MFTSQEIMFHVVYYNACFFTTTATTEIYHTMCPTVHAMVAIRRMRA
jgi:hypothetical protein